MVNLFYALKINEGYLQNKLQCTMKLYLFYKIVWNYF